MFKELFKHTTVMLIPPGHGLFHGRPLKLEDIASWRLTLMAPESLLGQSVGQAYESRGLSSDVVPALDNIESMKRYLEIGMGIGIRSGFTLHANDHHRLGVVRLDHLFPGSVIGVCAQKGKFAGPAVQNSVEMMSEQIRGCHADTWMREEQNGAGAGRYLTNASAMRSSCSPISISVSQWAGHTDTRTAPAFKKSSTCCLLVSVG